MPDVAIPESEQDAPPDDDLRRRAIPVDAPPVQPAPAIMAKAIPEASPSGSTDDLEDRGLQSHMARPIPISASPSAPVIPEGSVNDLEQKADQRYENPRPAPIQTGVASLWGKAQNIHNPVLRVLGEIGAGGARALDTAGTILAPRVAAAIPGTTLNEEMQQGRSAAQEKEQAGLGLTKAQTGHVEAETGAIPSTIAKTEAETKALGQQKQGLTPEETTIHDLMTGENGQPRINPDTNKPYSYLDAFSAVKQAAQDTKADKAEKLNDFEQYYHQYLTDNRFPDTSHNRLLARRQYEAAGQQPQRPQQQLAVIDGKVVELKPGMAVPDGTKSLTGDLAGSKPNAEELKRSEMAENMGENLDKLEDIVKRRPDLFGKVSGRITQGKMWLGSDDPDVGALSTIKDQIGMAQQSAHSMRSAQHVEAAANSILNSFKNGPDAINGSIKTARDSLSTFSKDVQQGNPSVRKSATAQGAHPPSEAVEYKPGLVRNGYKFNGGDPADKKNWVKQ